MSKKVSYASLAIYSKENIVQEIGKTLQMLPSRTGERNGTYSWIYSTQEASACETVEQHIDLLKTSFYANTQSLIELAKNGCEIRVWIYFGVVDANQSFVASSEFVAWLALFGADIYVDVWSD